MDSLYIRQRMDRLQIRKLPGLSISSAEAAEDDVPAEGDEFFFIEVPPCPRPKTPRKKEEAGCSVVSRERHNPASPTPSSSSLGLNTTNPAGHQAGYSPASPLYRGLTHSPEYSPASPPYFSDTSAPFTYSPGYSPSASPTNSSDTSEPMSPESPGHQVGYSPASPTYSSDTSEPSTSFDNWQYTPQRLS